MSESLFTDSSDRSLIPSSLSKTENSQFSLIQEAEIILTTGERTTNFDDYGLDLETAFPTHKYETESDEFLFTESEIFTVEPTQNPMVLRSASQTTKDPLTGLEDEEELIEISTVEEPALLFDEVPEKGGVKRNFENSPIIRQRQIKLDFNLLDNTDKSDKIIRLNLFSDVTLDVELDQVKSSPNKQDWVRTGKVIGVENSQVILISSKDENNILGEIRLDYSEPEKANEFYEIRSTDKGKFVVNQLETSSFSQCYFCGGNHETPNHQDQESNLEDSLGSGSFDSVFNSIVRRKISPLSNNQKVDSLLTKTFWDTGEDNVITYSFLSNQAVSSYYGRENPLSPTDPVKRNVKEIFDRFEQYLDVTFKEVADTVDNYGQIRIMLSNGPLAGESRGYTYQPPDTTESPIDGDIHLSSVYQHEYEDVPGSYGYITIAHEIGHALGLKHPGNYSSGEPSPFLSYAQDNNTNTMMTYVGLGGFNQYSTTPMPYDIQSLQYLYGRNNNFNSQNTTYSFDSIYGFDDGNQYLGSADKGTKVTLWDGGGFDTIDLSKLPSLELKDFSYDYRIDLREGGLMTTADAYNNHEYIAFQDTSGTKYKTTTSGTAIAYDTVIENLINSGGDDVIYANNAANKFSGYAPGENTGNDQIFKTNQKDILDLSEYSRSEVKKSRKKKDLILDLGEENGSITIANYYGVKAAKRMKILYEQPTKPEITINDITVSEGDSGTEKAKFTINLSEPSDKTVKVNFVTANDTAEVGSDYRRRKGTVTFKPGQTTKQITVPVLGDTADEFDEEFFVKLSKPRNATIADNKGVATIKNDDLTSISISPATITEGNIGNKKARFAVTLDQESPRTITVDYRTEDSTAIEGSDYRSKTGTLTFKPGQTKKIIQVPIIGDQIKEIDEYFWVRLSNSQNATIDQDNRLGFGTIKDNDN
ncbi:Calx-beta domain-containing protein [Okeania sp.]|uniref:Calx-beta domain-containing protein n=1 Tax=Okeania sp. TaxID=3100323 RepID=UPI002B4B2D4F|nr:Calx-beta domain-containing protein [Okeania sp.]MEB3343350.1 Calx-beta domain-containing protein [Okeania sp.]